MTGETPFFTFSSPLLGTLLSLSPFCGIEEQAKNGQRHSGFKKAARAQWPRLTDSEREGEAENAPSDA